MTPSTSSVCAAVGQALGGLTPSEIANRQRGTLTKCLARSVAAYVLRSEFGLSYQEIALELKFKEHSTAMTAVSRVTKRIEAGEPRVCHAVRLGEAAAEEYRQQDRFRGLTPADRLVARRREITKAMIELVAEARQIDQLLGRPVVPEQAAAE